jgi:hypothetical protein
MNEHSFIRAVHAHLPPEVFRWKIHDKFAGGVPDAFYAGPASTLFVEYKYVKTLPKRDDTLIRTCLTPQQIHWLNTLHDYNQPVALIVAVGDQALVLLDKRWNTNISKTGFLKEAIQRNRIASWIAHFCGAGGKTRHDDGQKRADRCYEPTTNLEPEEI